MAFAAGSGATEYTHAGRFLHFYTGRKATSCWCRNNHSGCCWVQQISYQPLKCQNWSLLTWCPWIAIPSGLVNKRRELPEIPLIITSQDRDWREEANHPTIHLPQFFAFCVTSSIFHLGSSFIRGKVQVSDYSPFTLGLHTSVSIVFWWFLEDADMKLSDS